MARLNLDNFPQPKTEWSDGQKFALIALTAGLVLLIWLWVKKANEAKQLAQTKMAESDEKQRAAELKNETMKKAVAAITGQETAAVINLVTDAAIKEAQNPPNVEGSI